MKTEQNALDLALKLEIVKRWKELKISKVVMEFQCGGDSMGDTSFNMYDENGEIPNDDTIVDYFDDVVDKHVDFYVNSDGHYQGESGYVYITLNEDVERLFEFCKSSTSEWSESFSNTGQVELTQEEVDFIKTYIRSIEGGYGEDDTINYLKDFIISDKQQEMLDDVLERMKDMAVDLEMEGVEAGAECNDDEWYRITYINIDGDNNMHVEVSKSFTFYKEDE